MKDGVNMKSLKILRATKIVSTLGPSTSDYKTIKSLMIAGVNVFRLNFSHGSQEDHKKSVEIIRRLEMELDFQIAILADLQGPKFRIGYVKDKIILKKGNKFVFDQKKDVGDENRVYLSHKEIYNCVKKDTVILIDDGKIKLEVIEKTGTQIVTQIIDGGTLTSNKGLNLPNAILETDSLTLKDKKDLKFILKNNIEWIAISFVQKLSDVLKVKKIVKSKAAIISKIEKPSALNELNEIILASDAIMVARGDLGVELPPERVPGIQKDIILACRTNGKPVIVATQMLESMILSPAPTRAEASDVATAVFDGADAVMLSAETAVGRYPIETVKIMDRIIKASEHHIKTHRKETNKKLMVDNSIYYAVSRSAVDLAETVNARAIVAFTASGKTALRISRERPDLMLIVMTPENQVRRRMSLIWGSRTYLSKVQGYEAAIQEARTIIKKNRIANNGQNIVVVAGMPFGISGSTNSIRVVTI